MPDLFAPPDATATALSVSELTDAVKQLLEGFPPFREVTVRAELGNFTRHSSGHWYFTLKDAEAQLTGVMFRQSAVLNGYHQFKTGDEVEATGAVRVFAQRGVYQLVVHKMRPVGQGDLFARFQALKEKLAAAGLFAPERKRALMPIPRRVAVITSPTGAVIQDICSTLARRAPYVQVVLVPAVVQGQDALPSLLSAFAGIPATGADTVILARGGGSMEDLWCFNEERLAHAILACPVPVVSAVGHETDFTIADFVADLRAPTPTAAAELIARSRADLQTELATARRQAANAVRYRINEEWMRLDDLRTRLRHAVQDRLNHRRQALQYARARLTQAAMLRLAGERRDVAVLRARLSGLDFRATLARGFSLTLKDGKPLLDAALAPPGTRLRTLLATGEVGSVVE